uniref:EPS8 signaling adaptor L1a n=1 Tax=Astyanax mexicanus TaxID=7994 RepID=W5JZ06_ASTMX
MFNFAFSLFSPSQMAAPQALPRKHSNVNSRMLKVLPGDAQLNNPHANVNGKKTVPHVINAQREVDLLNHCFADVETFMGRLQQAANARTAVEQSKKKKKAKKDNSKKKKQQYDLMAEEVPSGPSGQEFVDIFQKIKYSFSLLGRLKNEISKPSSEELLHHLFVPLDLLVKTTGGPDMAAGVSSPALTSGAVGLLQQNLSQEERELWESLGPNWTQSYSQQTNPVSPYTPVFLDGWQPEACDASGQAFEDPVESQHKYEAQPESQQFDSTDALPPNLPTEENVENPPPSEGERLYRCSYDFVARNSSELSVLHGETLQVLESSKRWWKCRNNYDQIGFVPSNILEPVNHTEPDSRVVMRHPSTRIPLSPPGGGRFSYVVPSSSGEIYSHNETRPHSMPPIGDDGERVTLMNNELAERLANGRTRPSFVTRTNETASLNYHSAPGEVQDWLKGKGFSEHTVNSLGILSGAQLFSLNKEELCTVSPQEGGRVYSQLTIQKALLEKVNKATELDAVMKKQKMKVDPQMEGGEF